MIEKRKPLPTNITTRSAFTLKLAAVGCGNRTNLFDKPTRIDDPADRARLTADLAEVRKLLTDLLGRYAYPNGDGFKLRPMPPWAARQKLAEIEELQSVGQELEQLLGEE
jgi:hypothetical protein